MWKIRDLLLAKSKDDIIVILPINLQLIYEKTCLSLVEIAESQYIDYMNRITSHNFGNVDDISDFLDGISTSHDLCDSLNRKSLLPIQFRSVDSLDLFFKQWGEVAPLGEGRSIAWNFGLYLHTQFIRVQEHKYFCEHLSAEPIYDNELPWFFYTYEAGGPDLDASIANALQKDKFDWITGAPIEAIRIFREEGQLDYMRSVLRTGITDLKAKTDKDLSIVSEQLEENMNNAFKQQRSEINALEERVRSISKVEIPLTTVGSLIGFVPYLGNVVSIGLAGRDTKRLLEERSESKKMLANVKSNIINLLMETNDEQRTKN